MNLLADIVAGCDPTQPECAAGTVPNDIDTWFIVLVLFLALALVAGAALLLRHWLSRRSQVASSTPEPTARA
jgi:flagellar biogenesis protein FliO